MATDKIIIKGAREHNLKNIDVEIPRDKLVVITGLSGSGKSSLAFDTIYAEGQRRYVESLSAYARQFLGQMEKPDLDHIEGLSPAISIDQRTTSKNPRSTVGTVTEIHDYMRLLFARAGRPHCPSCGRPIARQSVDQIVDAVRAYPEGSSLQILAPLARGRKGEYQKLFASLKADGFVRVRVNGETRELGEEIKLDKQKKHTIELVVDRLTVKQEIGKRLTDSVELALSMADGLVTALLKRPDGQEEELLFSQNFACVDCGVSIEEITPRMFSFNNPYGACPACSGLGYSMRVDENLLINDATLSLRQGGLVRWSEHMPGWYMRHIEAVAQAHGFSLDVPLKDLPDWAMREIFYGCGKEKFPVRFDGASGQH
ncbi:MAG: excinuclease ABC subunit UvrA, partial [Clostridiales bacterium]|nr:excinuclease ABC subunit UvrA [Clostridiales bacterium]